MMRRRDILGTIGCCAVAVSLAGGCASLPREDAPAADLQLTQLADRLFLIEGAAANVVVAVGSEGLLLVDGGGAAHARALLALLEARWPGAPVQVLLNTHWHLDHTGFNDEAGARKARIIAHENTRLWMKTDFQVEWEQRRYAPRAAVALPTQTFYTRGQLDFAGLALQYVHTARAHTDGDLFVHFPDANLIVAGGLVAKGHYPVLDYSTGGFIRGLRDASKELLTRADAQTRVVPGRGPALDRAHLESQAQMLEVLAERLVDLMKKGLSPDEMLAASATGEFDAQWGDPTLFVHNAYRGMWGHVHSLGVF